MAGAGWCSMQRHIAAKLIKYGISGNWINENISVCILANIPRVRAILRVK